LGDGPKKIRLMIAELSVIEDLMDRV